MGGQSCALDIRVSVSLIVNMMAKSTTFSDIINDYEYRDEEDLRQVLILLYRWLAIMY